MRGVPDFEHRPLSFSAFLRHAPLQEEVPKEEKAEGDEDKIEEVKDDDEPKEKKKKKVGIGVSMRLICLPALPAAGNFEGRRH